MRNKLTIGAFLLMLTAFIVVLALPADEESIKSENRVMATIPPVNEETVFSGEFETGFESFIGDNIAYENFIVVRLQTVQDFSPHRDNCLKFRIPSQFAGTQSRISLHDIDFTAGNIFGAAVDKLLHSVGDINAACQFFLEV